MIGTVTSVEGRDGSPIPSSLPSVSCWYLPLAELEVESKGSTDRAIQDQAPGTAHGGEGGEWMLTGEWE